MTVATWILPSIILWAIVFCLPWLPWSVWERLEARGRGDDEPNDADLHDVVVLIPARNEANNLKRTLPALLSQGDYLKVFVVDDRSVDKTADVVTSFASSGVHLVSGTGLPAGWSGKVWAQAQGEPFLKRPYVLLLDADIELVTPGIIVGLRDKLKARDAGLVSVMATLAMHSFWERLLMPAFVYFFKLLYPFRLCNSPHMPIAAAAGGCMLLRAEALRDIGGFGAVRGALIDDCELARHIKRAGYGTWLGLSRDVVSLRRNERLRDTWRMVARTAFAQLGYARRWLLFCSLMMVLAFVLPMVAMISGDEASLRGGLLAWGVMALTYLPTLRFYRRSWLWTLGLPVAGVLYLLMTWTSAIWFWQGKGAPWRGRWYPMLGRKKRA